MNEPSVEIDVDDVIVGDRLRAVDTARVEEIAHSMDQVGGQIAPIEVAPADEAGKYRLISGAHRLEAVRLLNRRPGMPRKVTAVVFTGSADDARMREIDENLIRHDLTPYDRAAFLAERAAIWKRAHGETRGGARSKSANLSPRPTLYGDVEENYGIPKRTAIRAVKLRERICNEAWMLLREHPVRRNQSELDALARLDPKLQVGIAKLLVADRMMTFGAAKRQFGIGTQKRDPIDALARTINGLSTADLKRLVARIQVRVAPMLHKLEAKS